MATEEGIVIKIDSDLARVRTTKSSACKSCTAKNSCSSTAAGKDMEVDAINMAGAQVGDRILLHFETASLLKATFLLYIFPILCMLFGASVGHWLSMKHGLNVSAVSAIAGFSCLILAFVMVRTKANKMAQNERYRPKIVKILRAASLFNGS